LAEMEITRFVVFLDRWPFKRDLIHMTFPMKELKNVFLNTGNCFIKMSARAGVTVIIIVLLFRISHHRNFGVPCILWWPWGTVQLNLITLVWFNFYLNRYKILHEGPHDASIFFLMYLWKEGLNSDGHQFHKYE
jgi:hypothetical protein